MPKRDVHDLINMIILGKSYSQVSHALDLPAKQMGPSHRKYLHDPKSAYIMGYLVAGPRGGLAALIHLKVDSAIKSDSPLALALEIISRKRKRY